MAESDIMFSSLDENELITEIKRPSLVSITSEDSHAGSDEDKNIPSNYGPINYNIVGSTPIHESIDEYDFKMPPFPSLRDGKRFSLTPQDNPCVYAMSINKSNSMHDVSSIASFSPLRRNSSCMYSTETLQSNSIATTKSKDSGFQRSTSCSSLTTNASKKYDHVQSKVKQYIHTIKQTEALRKMQKRLERQCRESMETLSSPETSPPTESIPVSKKDLLNKVKELEEEIKEKDCVIEQLEKNHSELRLKYAAAETRIDDLRIRVSQNDDPISSYISDEKVADLLSGSIKNPGYVTKSIANPCIKKEPDFTSYEAAFARPFSVRQLQPIKKFSSSSIRLNETYPVLKSNNISKSSSCKYVKESNYELSKSASSLDKACAGFAENDVLNYSRAKVQQWQRSLVNLNQANEDQGMEVCYPTATSPAAGDFPFYEPGHRRGSRCCLHDEDADSMMVAVTADTSPSSVTKCASSRLYQKNKDADKKNYRKSYPVGCKCDKYKKVKEEKKIVPRTGKKKILRSVSFASSYDNESITSSMYEEEEDSSSDSSAAAPVFVSKHESYKDYKQRKLLEKYERRRTPPKWSEIKKAKSASNIHRDHYQPSRNKRLIDNVSTSYEHSCPERKHCSGSRSHKNKYRKLDDCSKVAATGCANVLSKCRSTVHVHPEESSPSLKHSKSFDVCGHRHEDEASSSHRYNKLECSCLTALEKLKIQEHNTLAKFAEHMKKHSRSKPIEDNSVQMAAYKRYSLNK